MKIGGTVGVGRARGRHEAQHDGAAVHPARRAPARRRQRQLPDVDCGRGSGTSSRSSGGPIACTTRCARSTSTSCRRTSTPTSRAWCAAAPSCASRRTRTPSRRRAPRAAPSRRRVGLESPFRRRVPASGRREGLPPGNKGAPRNGVNDTRRSPMPSYKEFHRRSLADRDAFWREQAALIDWQTPFTSVLDYSKPPFAKWFVGGRTNLCHNAVDRHLATRARPEGAHLHLDRDRTRPAPTRTASSHAEVNRFAAMLQGAGRRPRRPRADLHADDRRRRRSRCSPARASARSTRSCSAASPRRASPRASTTRSRR